MNSADVFKYLDLPHVYGANGPDAYDCWNLLRHVQQTYFNKAMPIAPIGDEDACLQLFRSHCRSGEWQQVDQPSHGDAALMREGRQPHVGIYLDIDGGGILHALEDIGVIWTRAQHLHSFGFGRTTYYRINSNVE